MRAYTPRPWVYKDYLEATARRDNAESQKRWLDIVALLNKEYAVELNDVIQSVIGELDKEL